MDQGGRGPEPYSLLRRLRSLFGSSLEQQRQGEVGVSTGLLRGLACRAAW